LTLTAGVFVAATVTAVGVGLQGAGVSPVASVAATAPDADLTPAPLVGEVHGPAADHRQHR
jgi:hypothetical protein